MGYESFDDFDSTEQLGNHTEQKPFQFRENKDPKGTLDWLNQNFDLMEKKSQSRLFAYKRWAALYKGIHWRKQDTRDYSLDLNINTKKPRMVDNFVMDLIDHRVAQMTRFGTNFSAIPWNNETSDEMTAKACEKLLKGRADEIDLDKAHRDADKIKYKFGTSFLFTEWDKDLGAKKEAVKRLEEIYKGKQLPKKVLAKIEGGVNIGDVNATALPPYRVFPEIGKNSWFKKGMNQGVNHVDLVEWVNIDELKAEHPTKDIQPNHTITVNYH